MGINDNDDPEVTVNFAHASYSVAEGGTVTVTVQLSADPERLVVIPADLRWRGVRSDRSRRRTTRPTTWRRPPW